MDRKDINKKNVGKRIKQIRLSNGWTLIKFSDEISKIIGDKKQIAEGVISRWESGISLPNPKRLKAIAKIADITVEELLHGNFQRYYFDKYWEELIINRILELNGTILSENEFEYLEKNNEHVFKQFIQLSLNFDYRDKTTLKKEAKNLLIIASDLILLNKGFSEVDTLKSFLHSLKQLKENVDKKYHLLVDGQKQFNKDYDKLTYDKLTSITDTYIEEVEKLYKLTRKRYFKYE